MTCQNSLQVYQTLEPLLSDYRRLAVRGSDGHSSVLHMDEFIDSLLNDDIVWGITLPRLPKRWALQEQGLIKGERKSALAEANLLSGEDDGASP